MGGLPIGLLIESIVSILLVLTIGYCYVLNKRLVNLQADKETMRDMISDLVEATNMANSAIGQLKDVAGEADSALNARLEEAERFTLELANHVVAGQSVVEKISKITSAARQSETIARVETRRAGMALEQLEIHERRKGRAA
ncbi:MAG TPA: chemotaxis protein [Devosia sp.]|nr:chemotaxis protein [Devosia sp.]